MTAHAELPPSSIEQVLLCPGSWRLQRGAPDTSSYYSREGTAAHTIAARSLLEQSNASVHLGAEVEVEGDVFIVDDEMASAVQVYLDAVRRLSGQLFVEERVVVAKFDTWGTADAIVLDEASATLHVVDLKYGKGVAVSAVGNAQLRTYALGALEEASLVADIEHVQVWIVQPRADSVTTERLHRTELVEWADRARETLDMARTHDAPPLVPGAKQCRFCRAKQTCPALRQIVVDTTPVVFEDLTAQTEAERLAAVLPKLDLIEDWCKAQRAAALDALTKGCEVPGFKLVEGRRGSRVWSNEGQAADLMRNKFRLKKEEMFEQKLITPAAAERLLAESPTRWKRLQQLIHQPGGRPTVVPVSDKRPAVQPARVQFDDLTGER